MGKVLSPPDVFKTADLCVHDSSPNKIYPLRYSDEIG